MANAQDAATSGIRWDSPSTSIVDRLSSFVTRLLGFANRRFVVRSLSITSLCILPLAIAIAALPQNASRVFVLLKPFEHIKQPSDRDLALAGLFSTLVAIVVAVLINRAWARNERQRQDFANRYAGLLPANLPDLRLSAAVSAIAIFLLAPLFMFYANRVGCKFYGSCFFSASSDQFSPWLAAGFERFLQASTFSIIEYVIDLPAISLLHPINAMGRAIEVGVHIALQLFVIAVGIEILRIRSTIATAVAELKTKADIVTSPDQLLIAKIGTRALPSLYRAIGVADESESGIENRFAHNAARVLQMMGDRSSIPPLIRVFLAPGRRRAWARWRALQALEAIAARLANDQSRGMATKILNRASLMRLRLWVLWRSRLEAWRPYTTRSELVAHALAQLQNELWRI